MAKLVIYEESDGEETIFEDFDLSSQRILIGASEDNNLILDVPGIDPTHASLELRDNQWVLQDLGAPGGTWLNGVEIEGPHHLQDNDLIELNTVKIRFQENELAGKIDEEILVVEDLPAPETPLKGRVWFGAVAGVTLIVIFAIVLALVIADYLEFIRIADLLPPWFG